MVERDVYPCVPLMPLIRVGRVELWRKVGEINVLVLFLPPACVHGGSGRKLLLDPIHFLC